jgi:Mor family transcriptional regulator
MWEQRLYQLTDAQKKRCSDLYANGVKIPSLAKRFAVSGTTIWRAIEESKTAAGAKR